MRTFFTLLSAFLLTLPMAQAQEAEGRKYALLIGVQQYDRNQLRNLPFAERDVTELAKLLEQSGFRRVVLLTQAEGAKQFKQLPTSANIRTSLAGILEDRTKDDLVLVGFAGHGIQFRNEEENYFCPMDAVLTKRESLVSLKEVYAALEKSTAGTKLLLVDACRNDPLAENARSRAEVQLDSVTRPQLPDPPGGVAAFFSCSRGQKAFEDDMLKHGIFFHHVILGLKGAAKLSNRDEVTWDSLVAYTKSEVPDTVKDLFGDEVRQVPEHRGQLAGSVALLSIGKTTREILDKAMKVTYSISDEQTRALLLGRIAACRAKAGDKQAARLIFGDAKRVARSLNSAEALANIAVSQAVAGESAAALETARSISDESVVNVHYWGEVPLIEELGWHPFGSYWDSPSNKLSALVDVALVQAASGERPAALAALKEALHISRLISNEAPRVSALTRIALAQAQSGDNQAARATLQDASRLARGIEIDANSVSRSVKLNHIALAQLRVGDVDAGRATLQEALQAARLIRTKYSKMAAQSTLALVQARIGDKPAARITIEDALRDIRSNEDDSSPSSYLDQIVTVQVEAEGIATALQTARSMRSQEDQASALGAIAGTQAKAGDFVSALATVRSIPPLKHDQRTGYLAAIAAAQADAGDVISARATTREAVVSAENSAQKEGDIFLAFTWVAIAQAKAGRTSEASATVRDVLLPRWGEVGFLLGYAPVVSTFCSAQVKHGGTLQVYELANSIPIASDQVVVLVCLAEAILQQQKPILLKKSSEHIQPTK